ncbi:acyl-CoA thioester hydrolase [Sporosarcina sp. P37]|uniref:acyl-CoA thioesterase n=1 Tax=unclassified Sporosarcina TaxID=2647733 RepID=UPI0009C0B0BA|nr:MULTISPECIES: thioesterase family protein [unclassified Sporosarcina]ARD47113.1 acyl-CoA thioester hydrolase [Sporosarcina sp. P33]ARK23678.1 acyl-CoA thioester hydrolase [Sporosarcina sp. P37]PID17326.1 acyl-CoA thioesterase [Sporosarcina sp. P35]
MRATYIQDAEKWEESFTFHADVSVRFSETDMYGHLNNTKVFAYFEYARIEYLKSLNRMEKWIDPKGTTIPIVADLQCDFVKQVFFDEKLRIYVKADSMGKSSVDLHYMAKNERNEIVFTGRGTIVQIGRDTGKPVAWTEEEKQVFLENS